MQKSTKIIKKKLTNKNEDSNIEIEKYFDKYFWLIIPILTVIYFLLSKYSIGFYQDDELAHFVNAKKFWIDPSIIFGNWPKPGYKIFLVLPAYISYDAVIVINSLISAITVFATYQLLKLLKIEYAFWGALILAFQPLFFDLSFRSYAEIFTALLFLTLIITYKKENYFFTGLICGYLFTVRQETILLAFIMVIIFIKRKRYLAITSFLIFPLIYNLVGYISNGDIIYVFSQMVDVGNIDVGGARRGYFHYFKVLIYIISPVTLCLLIMGFFGFLSDTKKIKDYFLKYDLLYIIVIVTIIAQISAMQKGVNPGSWRYILHIAPLLAIFANIGLIKMIKENTTKFNMSILIIYIIVVLAFLSKDTNGLDLLNEQSYLNFIFAIGIFGLYFLFKNFKYQKFLKYFSISLIVLNILFLVFFFKPRKLSDANITMKQAAEYISASGFKDKVIYTTHSNFDFYGSQIGFELQNIRSFNSDTLKIINQGDIIIWDSFYSYRPEYKWDVQFDVLYKDTVNFKFIRQFNSNNKFAAFIYQKK